MTQEGRRRLRNGREVPVHDNDGLRKICGCPRRLWAKCKHSWHFAYCWKGRHYRFSLDRYANKHVEGKTEATDLAERLSASAGPGRQPCSRHTANNRRGSGAGGGRRKASGN
jgi:hypothetical protein